MSVKLFNDEELYTVAEVSEKLKITKEVVYFYVKQKRLPAVRVGNMYRLRGADLNEFFKYTKEPAAV